MKLLLALFVAYSGQQPTTAPKPDLPRLLKLYRELKLPLPPTDAVPIAWPTSGTYAAEDRTMHTMHSIGFRAPKETTAASAKKIAAGDPRIQHLYGDDWGHLGTPFYGNGLLATAIQLEHLGYHALAEQVAAVSAKRYESGPFRFVMPRGQFEKEVLFLGLASAMNAWMSASGDRRAASALAQQIASHELLKGDERAKQYADWIAEGMSAALKPSTAPAGSVEAAIDGLVFYRLEGTIAGLLGLSIDYPKGSPVDVLMAKGFDAVPAMIEHLEDRRMTTSYFPGFNNFVTRPLMVQDLMRVMLDTLLGEAPSGLSVVFARPEDLKKAWQKIKGMDEKEFCRKHLIPAKPRTSGDVLPNPAVLAICRAKYPALIKEALARAKKTGGVYVKPLEDALKT